MEAGKKSLAFSVLLIALGSGWLLTVLGVAPGIDWVWVVCLATLGLLTLALGGIDKVTIVLGPLFIAASCLSLARQAGRIAADTEVPVLVILLGVLLLVARMPSIAPPQWLVADSDPAKK